MFNSGQKRDDHGMWSSGDGKASAASQHAFNKTREANSSDTAQAHDKATEAHDGAHQAWSKESSGAKKAGADNSRHEAMKNEHQRLADHHAAIAARRFKQASYLGDNAGFIPISAHIHDRLAKHHARKAQQDNFQE